MTRSVREILAVTPGQANPAALDDNGLSRYLQEHCDKGGALGVARQRATRHAIRDAFYRDGGAEVMERIICDHFKHPDVQAMRKASIELAGFSNPLKTIVWEVSTVYAEPSTRRVGGSEANEAKYRAIVEELMLDEQMAEANRLVNLHAVILVGPRVRQNPDDSWSFVLDIATPAVFRPVLHPTDGTLVVGWLIKCESRIRPDMVTVRAASWELWTDHELIFLDENFVPIGPDVPHGLGVNRWMPLSFTPVSLPGFWPGEEGEDLVAATKATRLAAILLVKETASATKQTFMHGDFGAAAAGQPLDTSIPAYVPEGSTATTVDMTMDTGVFIRADDHILQRVANARGISLGDLKREGVQSAEAREVKLEPLKRRRREQIKYARRWEKQLAHRMSKVGKASGVESLAFEVVAWSQDFGEIQSVAPLLQRIQEHIALRQVGIDNRVRFAMRENPDFTTEQALEFIASNFALEAEIVGLMKNWLAVTGATAPTAGTDGARPAPLQGGDTRDEGDGAAAAPVEKEAA